MKLLFTNPVFISGVNLTCRKGDKWANAKEPKGGFPIVNTATPDQIVGYAYDTFTESWTFKDLKEFEGLLTQEHDPECQTYDGLLKKMKEVYPDFTEEDEVTMLYFKFKLA